LILVTVFSLEFTVFSGSACQYLPTAEHCKLKTVNCKLKTLPTNQAASGFFPVEFGGA